MEQSRPKGIIEGFEDDFERIKTDFARVSPGLTLEDFYSYWGSTEMDCLFANRFDPRELLEMITEANRGLMTKVVSKEADLTSRIIALYFLLCISGKQPDRLRLKIRFTCGEAIEVSSICDTLKQVYSHNDARTAWNMLLDLNSIDFVEERQVFGPVMLEQRRVNVGGFVDASTRTLTDGSIGRDGTGNNSSRIATGLDELEQLSENYHYLRDLLKLDEVNDATVDIESTGTLRDHLAQVKSLIREYKA